MNDTGKQPAFTVINTCRNCGSDDLFEFLSLGEMPLANSLLSEVPVGDAEPKFPLTLVMCPDCSLVQNTVSISPEALFSDYLYFSSFSDTMLQHARGIVEKAVGDCGLDSDSLAVEIASNDGYLLQYFVERGIPVLGIEPAANVAKAAEEKGVQTLVEFFGEEVALALRGDGMLADALFANNVLAHVPELHDFVEGIRLILKPGGRAYLESPYLQELVGGLKFDTIYHEHIFQYSLTALKSIFEAHDLAIVDAEMVAIHGGSMRITVMHEGAGESSGEVAQILEAERPWAASKAYYAAFATRVDRLGGTIRDVLSGLKAQGRTVAGYGAAAKATVFLNAYGIGTDLLDYVVDRSPHKQGLLMPGCHIPVVSPEHMAAHPPDYLLIFVWNIAQEVMAQQADYQTGGGRFIISVPHVEIL